MKTYCSWFPIIFMIVVSSSCKKTSPIAQPPLGPGPGGNTYMYAGVSKISFPSNGGNSYIFQPSPMPTVSLPCIAFQHGYDLTGDQMAKHLGLINHLVKKGYIIIYDEFQPSPITLPGSYETNAATIIKDGISYIANHPATCVKIATDGNGLKQFGLIGYSVGGVTSVNLAANYVDDSLPKPKFLYTMETNNGGLAPMRNASSIPPDTYVVVVDAQDDDQNTFKTSSTYWNQMTQIPSSNKQWTGIYSDTHPNNSSDNLVADHASVLSDYPNALDVYGYFKWGTALANFSFYGTDKEYWWGNTPEQTYMGVWNDGVEVIRARGSQQAFWPGH